jgi:hypothetical protein
VGYGDIAPRAYMEMVYVIIFSIICAGIFGYTMGIISGIF